METELSILLATAVSVSVLHTVAGPDHYIPFIAIGKSKGWNLSRILFWTLICGVAHVFSSLFLAIIGIGLGYTIGHIEWIDGLRGGIASWALFVFGVLYFIYGLYSVYHNKTHKHFDIYDDGSVYVFEHNHSKMTYASPRKKVTPWVLFIIFLLGPCEALIPLLTYPVIQESTFNLVSLMAVFLFFTLLTMVVMVVLIYFGHALVKTDWLEKYMTPIAGFSIAMCGAGMLFLGW